MPSDLMNPAAERGRVLFMRTGGAEGRGEDASFVRHAAMVYWRQDGGKYMKLPRKWSKIGHGLLLAGVIGLLLELLFGIPNMEVGWKNIAAVIWMVVSMVLAFSGVALLQWKCKCPHCGRWSAPPWPWSEDSVRFCPRCGTRLEYDDT